MTSPFHIWATEPGTQLERGLAVLIGVRAISLLPFGQTAFNSSVMAFTRFVPEPFWGGAALFLSVWTWTAARRPTNLGNRRNAARGLLLHSSLLFPLNVLSNPFAALGWYHLLFALCAAVLVYARSREMALYGKDS